SHLSLVIEEEDKILSLISSASHTTDLYIKSRQAKNAAQPQVQVLGFGSSAYTGLTHPGGLG
ncbi:hypothetical protein LINGRAHAP2_LOCUS17385, partial [Linum grandiflorum]